MCNYFNPNDFFELAKELKSHKTESANRTVLNRCYYSCYLRIKDECYTKEKSIDDHISHDKAFYRVNRKNKKVGGYINRLYSSRLVADYSLNSVEHFELYRNKHQEPWGLYKIDVNSVNESIKTAQKFHDLMDQRKGH